jgi:hypothetical protein
MSTLIVTTCPRCGSGWVAEDKYATPLPEGHAWGIFMPCMDCSLKIDRKEIMPNLMLTEWMKYMRFML